MKEGLRFVDSDMHVMEPANGRTPRRSSRLIFRGVTAGSDCENLESTWGYEDVLPFRLRAPTSVVAGA
jgi:hypothetical protein